MSCYVALNITSVDKEQRLREGLISSHNVNYICFNVPREIITFFYFLRQPPLSSARTRQWIRLQFHWRNYDDEYFLWDWNYSLKTAVWFAILRIISYGLCFGGELELGTRRDVYIVWRESGGDGVTVSRFAATGETCGLKKLRHQKHELLEVEQILVTPKFRVSFSVIDDNAESSSRIDLLIIAVNFTTMMSKS